MTQSSPSRLTLLQRWYRLRTSPRFPFLLLLGLLTSGLFVQMYYYWWDVRVTEMLARNRGQAERMEIYPTWLKKSLGHKFVRRFEPIEVVTLDLDDKRAKHRPDDIGLLQGALFLHELRLSGPLTDDDARHLKRLTQLKTVHCRPYPEPAIDAISGLNLKTLRLGFKEEPDPSIFRRIAAMPRLKQLRISFDVNLRSPRMAEGMRELAKSQSIYQLSMHLGDDDFLALTDPLPDGSLPLPALTELQISYSRNVTAQSLNNLKNLPNLVHLDLSFWSLTNDHLRALKQLPNLRTLYLEHASGLDEESIDILVSMPNLQSINVKWANVTMAGLIRLAKLPRLRCLRAHPGGLEARTELRKHLPAGCELDTN